MIAVEAFTFVCPCCGFLIADEPSGPGAVTCRRCNSHIEVAIFPALLRSEESHIHEAAIADESTCFFHADRVAAFACSRCGRFLCPLCRIEWLSEDLCPSCLEAAGTGKQADTLASTRFHFDSLALAMSTLPLLSGFPSILTAPVALGFALFTFRKQCSIAPRTKLRFLLSMLFSIATMAGWTMFFVYAFRRNTGGPPFFP
jgi:hypothetical protein